MGSPVNKSGLQRPQSADKQCKICHIVEHRL